MIHNILPVCRRRSCKQESHMKQLQNKSNTHIPPSARGEVKRNNSIYIQKGLLLCSLSICLSVHDDPQLTGLCILSSGRLLDSATAGAAPSTPPPHIQRLLDDDDVWEWW